jgi:monoamine oxidase
MSRRPSRVVVIGAGIAGLAAANALRDQLVDVVVVEARDRVGGRIWTVDGVDLGAHWIHGTEGNPVTTIARERNLSTLYVGGDSTYKRFLMAFPESLMALMTLTVERLQGLQAGPR